MLVVFGAWKKLCFPIINSNFNFLNVIWFFYMCWYNFSHIRIEISNTLSEPWLTFVTSGTSKSVQCLIWYSFWCLSKNISLLIYFIHFNGKDCVKDVRIRSFSCPYFPALGLNLDRYSLSLCIQSECAKTRTRKTPSYSKDDLLLYIKRRHIS